MSGVPNGAAGVHEGARLTLVSHHLCPYVQRAAIALAEKGVGFERIFIDLDAKPEWFTKISPLGKVPLLIVRDGAGGETAIFESAVILEYLEETETARPLHPRDPLARARHRGFIEFGSAILADLWGLETAKDAAGYERAQGRLVEKFARVEEELGKAGEGPFFAGAGFSLVDAVYAPVFRYFDVFDEIADTGILADLPQVKRWRKALVERDSVRDAVTPDYPDRLRAFLVRHEAHLLRLGEPA